MGEELHTMEHKSAHKSKMLDQIHALSTALSSTTSVNDKVRILREFSHLRGFMQTFWDPTQTTGLTRLSLDKMDNYMPEGACAYPTCPVELLRQLYSRQLSGNAAKYAVAAMVAAHPEYKETILRIASKNLKARVTQKFVNRAFPGLIQDFSVSLGYDLSKHADYFARHNDWYMSRKFDGVRCILRIQNGVGKCLSRVGHELVSLSALTSVELPDGVYDGEICEVDEHDKESFSSVVSKVRRHAPFLDVRFYIFDRLTNEEFDSGTSTRTLTVRRDSVPEIQDDRIRIVEQLPYSPGCFRELNAEVAEKNWEGIILRRDTVYKGRRSTDILKHKEFTTADYTVTGVDSATMRIIDHVEIEEEVLKSVTINHKGETVHVGSGFTLDQRREFFAHPERIIGHLIEVQYFEESCDATGKFSLRFPTVKQVYGPRKRKM